MLIDDPNFQSTGNVTSCGLMVVKWACKWLSLRTILKLAWSYFFQYEVNNGKIYYWRRIGIGCSSIVVVSDFQIALLHMNWPGLNSCDNTNL
jgi:hypothetical protein